MKPRPRMPRTNTPPAGLPPPDRPRFSIGLKARRENSAVLLCPRCLHGALTPTKVETFFVARGDVRPVHAVCSDFGDVNVDQSMGGSPTKGSIPD